MRQTYQNNRRREIGENCHHVLEAFGRAVNADILIDSSKTVDHLFGLISANPENVRIKLIHLTRDVRAVVYSKMKRAEQYKKYGAVFNWLPTLRHWYTLNQQLIAMKALFDDKDVIRIRYEDLCQQREKTLRSICEHFEIDFSEEMLHLSHTNKHNISGSSHRFTWDSKTPIHLDQRWKSRLPKWQAFLSLMIAYNLFKRLGY
jgi:hypothetical protein